MLNCSAKVYYSSLIKHILRPYESNDHENVKRCFETDVSNIVNILSGKPSFVTSDRLPTGNEITASRAIELDNKALLYIFCKNIKLPDACHIITPGYGSLYIGPFFQKTHGTKYSNLLKSTYIKDKRELDILSKKEDILDFASNTERLSKSKRVLLLDDNVGTGETVKEIREKLLEKSVSFYCGAVQYNWINYYRFFLGEKDRIFDTEKFDSTTPFNYPGHNLLGHAKII